MGWFNIRLGFLRNNRAFCRVRSFHHSILLLGDSARGYGNGTAIHPFSKNRILKLPGHDGTVWLPADLFLLLANLVSDYPGGDSDPEWCILHGHSGTFDISDYNNRGARYVSVSIGFSAYNFAK
jgi:hypothetical protein